MNILLTKNTIAWCSFMNDNRLTEHKRLYDHLTRKNMDINHQLHVYFDVPFTY